jgi:hypothetical protein
MCWAPTTWQWFRYQILVKGGGAEVDGLEGSNVGEELGHKRAAWGRMNGAQFGVLAADAVGAVCHATTTAGNGVHWGGVGNLRDTGHLGVDENVSDAEKELRIFIGLRERGVHFFLEAEDDHVSQQILVVYLFWVLAEVDEVCHAFILVLDGCLDLQVGKEFSSPSDPVSRPVPA